MVARFDCQVVAYLAEDRVPDVGAADYLNYDAAGFIKENPQFKTLVTTVLAETETRRKRGDVLNPLKIMEELEAVHEAGSSREELPPVEHTALPYTCRFGGDDDDIVEEIHLFEPDIISNPSFVDLADIAEEDSSTPKESQAIYKLCCLSIVIGTIIVIIIISYIMLMQAPSLRE